MKKIIYPLAVVAVFMAACSKSAPPKEPVRAVKVITVGVGAASSRREYAGEARAKVESRPGFRVGGKIIQRQAELGQQVRAVQVLAQLDPQDYKLAADATHCVDDRRSAGHVCRLVSRGKGRGRRTRHGVNPPGESGLGGNRGRYRLK